MLNKNQIPLILLSLALGFSSIFAQSVPLVLERADLMEGSQSANLLTLKGNIHFTHDSLDVKANNALWFTQKEELSLSGQVKFDHPAGLLRSEKGLYFKKEKLFRGIGEVWGTDSSGKYTLYGDTVNYHQEKDILEILSRGKAILLDGDSLKDTLTLMADFLTLSEKAQKAKAYNHVRIERGDLTLTCDSANLDRKSGFFKLSGNPIAYVKGYKISGTRMEGTLENQKMKSLLVINEAKAQRDTTVPLDSTETMLTEIYGDTLMAFFDDGQISQIETHSSSKSLFWDRAKPQFINKGNSDLMYLTFKNGKPSEAILKGEARTFYHLFDKEVLSGTNEAAGDSIKISIGSETLEKIRIFGNRASGVFSGEKKTSRKGKL